MILAAAPSFGHTTLLEWLWVAVPAALLTGALVQLWRTGTPATDLPRLPFARGLSRLNDSLRRVTGLPGWCAGGLFTAMWALIVAVVGFFWDVAWHIDFGRDTELFTVPHVLILTGLLGLGAAGLFSIGLASVERAPTAWRLGGLRIPRGALALGALSAGAALGFPLDDLWHATYGVDVTMWGPTHLMMIGGASLAPLALWLLAAEAGPDAGRPWARTHVRRHLAVAVALGLSTFQLEFDMGVPQWQALYQPVLIVLATSIALVAARVAFGRGWALFTAANFLVSRGVLALLVGPALGHVVPRFPLYLGIALVIEAGALLLPRLGALRGALLMGLGAATLGLASEWGFSQVWGRHPWQAGMVASLWVAVLAGLAGAVLGTALGNVLAHRRAGLSRFAVLAAFAGVIAALALPVARTTTPVSAVLRTSPAGPQVAAFDRDGLPSPYQLMNVSLTVSPPSAAVGADWFELNSWQGGASQQTPLVSDSPGHYRSAQPVPTGGTWKTLVWLAKGPVMMATAVSFPTDLQYGQPPVTPKPVQTVQFAASSTWLMRESHDGAVWPAVLAYTGLFGMAAVWVAVLVIGFASLGRGRGGGDGSVRIPERALRGRRAMRDARVPAG
ncbi:MAG TPA: hypothetical protein VN193_09180 [Candidatus Angelobacter sp.]|jgi:hypothetical protein|nr:hypothetical protein [Candidatus Angelobacter sp.]